MALILCIETSTTVCSVALVKNGVTVSLKEDKSGKSHSAMLLPFIDEVLRLAGVNISDVDAVAVSKGPGSYTGLRIGVSTAKGICYAIEKPLLVIDTLKAMAIGMKETLKNNSSCGDIFCPMIDARRMEVYSALFEYNLSSVRKTLAEIIDEHSFSEFLTDKRVFFAGDAVDKCKNILINHTNAVIMDGFLPSAKWLAYDAEISCSKNDSVDIAYFEPFYLKDFVAGKPKVKGLY